MPRGSRLADDAWRALVPAAEPPAARFDPESLTDLPAPAQRFLRRALPEQTPLVDSVAVTALGSIRLGSTWWAFHSAQVLRAGQGLVWRARVRRGLLRIDGADSYVGGTARLDFRLYRLVPVVREHGPDIDRSAAGRLAAETVAWLPQSLAPQAGMRWEPIDDEHALATVVTPAGPIRVQVGVDADGRLRSIRTMRWNSASSPPGRQAFGGSIDAEFRSQTGIRVAGSGSIGWGFGTDDWPDGLFFHFQLTSTEYPASK
ncbi:MAG: DUF6544 family protein [Actinomycetales bacterium]